MYDERNQTYVYDQARAENDFEGKHMKYHIEFFRNGLNSIIKMWLAGGCEETPQRFSGILPFKMPPPEAKRKDVFSHIL